MIGGVTNCSTMHMVLVWSTRESS